MPDRYRVIVSPQALDDLEQILDYVARDSPSNAVRVINRLLLELDSLEMFPGRYSEAKTTEAAHGELRSMPSPPFRILYQILQQQRVVRVVSVEHGARQR
jgi:addiction module RelE/StbE family toxin